MEQKTTNKQKLIEKIIGIINGEIPAGRSGLCIAWADDPENPNPEDWSVYLIDGKKSTYQEWKKYFGPLQSENG